MFLTSITIYFGGDIFLSNHKPQVERLSSCPTIYLYLKLDAYAIIRAVERHLCQQLILVMAYALLMVTQKSINVATF